MNEEIKAYHTELLEGIKCSLCQAGIAVSVGTLVAAALAGFPEDTAAIDAIAEALDLEPEVVEKIIEEAAKSPKAAIKGLCKALHAC